MIKLFDSSGKGGIISVADLFGYIIAFFIIWLFIISLKTANTVAHETKEKAVSAVTPVVEDAKSSVESSVQSLSTGKYLETANKYWDNVKKSTNVISKDSATNALESFNSSLNGYINSLSSENLNKPKSEVSKKERRLQGRPLDLVME